MNLLKKGLSFIPFDGRFTLRSLVELFPPLINKISYSNAFINFEKDVLLEQVVTEFDNSTKRNNHSNELTTINALIHNKNIIITKADKGRTTVILDKEKYLAECFRQLNDENFYRLDEENRHVENQESLNRLCRNALSLGFIDKHSFKKCTANNEVRIRKFYILPKIHKEITKWSNHQQPPGRPIISNINTEMSGISNLIVQHLSLLLANFPSILSSTVDFLDRIEHITLNDSPIILFTADVESLYTNMEIPLTLQIVRDFLNKFLPSHNLNNFVLKALEICLFNNSFEFQNKFYLQKTGIAMGTKFAPILANIYMAHFENIILQQDFFKNSILLYCRYIDDIFGIFTNSVTELKSMFAAFNSLNDNLNLTFSWSYQNIQFLDLNIFLFKNIVAYSPFIKPTASLKGIHKNSQHSKSIKENTISNEISRGLRNSYLSQHFLCFKNILFSELRSSGFSRNILRKLYKKFMMDRNIDIQNSVETNLGFKSCGHCSFCQYCSPSFTFTINKKCGVVIGHFNCNSSNVIYAIQCQKCNIFYIGETKQILKKRLAQHLYAIRSKREKHPLVDHFSRGHNINTDFKIFIIKGNNSWSDEKRLTIESKEINRFKTITPFGLNDKLSIRPQKRVILPFNSKSITLKALSSSMPVSYRFAPNLAMRLHATKFS